MFYFLFKNKYIIAKSIQGTIKYIILEVIETEEYLRVASETTIVINVIKNNLLFFSYLILFLENIIR